MLQELRAVTSAISVEYAMQLEKIGCNKCSKWRNVHSYESNGKFREFATTGKWR